jgi:nucleoside-diphosphate-sugar epimerase/predicted dehydrogenase
VTSVGDKKIMKSKSFRVALVGAGRISSVHIAALKAIKCVDIVAICDLNQDLVRERASQNNIPGVYTDVKTMLQEVRPDVVHLLTPPSSHFELGMLAARFGAHIYVEKPLASTEAQAVALVKESRDAGVTVCPGHSQLFDPRFLEACSRIKAGEIGRVVSVRVEQGFTYETSARSAVIPWSYSYDWGIFDNLMPHPLYLACHFLERPGRPEVVGFNVGRVREAAVEEIRVLIPSESAVGEVCFSLSTGPEVSRLEVVGTRGRVMVDFIAMTLLSTCENGLPGIVNRLTSNFRTALKLTSASVAVMFGIATGKIKRYMGLRSLVGEFYCSIQTGALPPVTAEQGVLNVRLMDQIKHACHVAMKARVVATRPLRPRVLVTGASGFLGGRLAERLSANNINVRATTRLISRARALPGVQWEVCDLSKESELRRALAGIETVFHCAALAGPPGSLKEYEEANVNATVRLAKLAGELGVKNLIYVSSLSVYGMPLSSPYLDEAAPYDLRATERGVYTQSKLEAEKALLDCANEPRAPRVIILRAGSLYGPGAILPTGRLPLLSVSQKPVLAGSRRVPMPLTYVDNLIDAMLAAARSEVGTGSVYNVVDSPETNQAHVATTLRQVSGGRIKPIFLPYGLAWLLMLAVDLLSLVRHREMGTARYRLRRTLADMRYECNAVRGDLGWEPRVSLREGLSRVIASSAETPFPY